MLEIPDARTREMLRDHTTMRVGGAVRWWVEVGDENALQHALQVIHRTGRTLLILGAGSNVIAHDQGFPGVGLKLGPGLDYMRVQGDLLVAGGAAFLPKLSKFALQNNLGGLEWACGIPGSLGASVWGNAGSRGFNGTSFVTREAGEGVQQIVAFDRRGQRQVLAGKDVQFSYRHSSLGELLVTEVTYRLEPLNEEKTARHREAVAELLRIRRATQPVDVPSAGCAWRNPGAGSPGAGKLIEDCGLKGARVGGASISDLHANFVVNAERRATGEDVRKLLLLVESTVREKTGIALQREVRVLEA